MTTDKKYILPNSENLPQSIQMQLSMKPKILEGLDVSQSYPLPISIEFSFCFGFLWYSSFVNNFPHFFKRLFRPTKIHLVRHSQNNDQIWLYELIKCARNFAIKLWTLQLSTKLFLLLLEIYKKHHRKENISVGGSKKGWDTLFWIYLIETWLTVFTLLWMPMSFSTFVF